jgi:hypothetical protein
VRRRYLALGRHGFLLLLALLLIMRATPVGKIVWPVLELLLAPFLWLFVRVAALAA